MIHISKNLTDRESSRTPFPIITILVSIIIMQAGVNWGTESRQAYASPALAASFVNCVNPTPPNSRTSAPPAPATPGIVVINEVLSSPTSQWNCATANNAAFNSQNEWIEIYNPQNQPLDLYAARATIDQGTEKSIVPFGSIILAHGFLVVFPFLNKSYQRLSSPSLVISQVVIDHVSVPTLAADTSYARIPDGSTNWQITTTPTIASSNQPPTGQTRGSTNTQNHTTQHKSTGRQGTSNNAASTDTPATGVQPTWSALRLPSSGSNTIGADNNTLQNSSPSPSSPATPTDPVGPFNKVLFTLLIVVFSLALVWGWRLYRRRKKGT